MTDAETYTLLALQGAIFDRNSSQRIADQIEAADALVAMLQTQRSNPSVAGAKRIAIHISGMQREATLLIVVQLNEATDE